MPRKYVRVKEPKKRGPKPKIKDPSSLVIGPPDDTRDMLLPDPAGIVPGPTNYAVVPSGEVILTPAQQAEISASQDEGTKWNWPVDESIGDDQEPRVEVEELVGTPPDVSESDTALVGTGTGAVHRETNAVLREKLEEANDEIARLKKQLAERGKEIAPPRIASLEDIKGFRKAKEGEVPCGRFCQTWHEHIR